MRRKRIYWLASLLLLSLPLSLSADDVVPFEIDDYASVTPFRERASRLRKEGRFEEAEKLRTKLGETLRRSGIHYYAAWQFYYAGQSHREIGAESLAEKSYLQAIGQIEAERTKAEPLSEFRMSMSHLAESRIRNELEIAFRRQGKMGLAWNCHKESEEVVRRLLSYRDLHQNVNLYDLEHYASTGETELGQIMIGQLANVVLSKALYLHCAGDTQKSIDLLRNLIKLLEGSKPYLPMAKVDLTTRLAFANSHLISKLRFIGCHDEADAMEEEFLGSNHDPETDWIRAAQEIQRVTDLRHVLKNAPEDTSLAGSGISPEDYLEKIERDVEDFRKKGDQYNWLRASFQYAELLVDYGFYPEASEILEAGINEAREKRLNRHLLKLLGVRARLKMEMGDYGDLEADYFEILNLTRVQGLKIDELVVYRSYSIFLMESERYEDAINIMRTLLNVEKIFKRESRIALIHARIAEIEMILGNHSEAERLWSVIDARPRITLCPSANRELSFRIARLKYLKRKGNEAEFDEYHAATVDFVEKSELSGLEKRLFLERDFVLPHPEAGRNRIEEVGAEKAPLIQPTLMTTRVAVGESARGRFYLSNLETQSLEGELRVNGKLRSQS